MQCKVLVHVVLLTLIKHGEYCVITLTGRLQRLPYCVFTELSEPGEILNIFGIILDCFYSRLLVRVFNLTAVL